ncbi:MAG: HAD-IIB family hydrolase [Desulfatibacillaceae bacterium]|nr:HAD-IIB family hydrolase [Desulfatibacillaceae bacterium]
MIFTDLDATLLDENTYSYKDAAPALAACKKAVAPIVLVSSKTFAEMVPLHSELSLISPLVAENGGGIFFPAGVTDIPKNCVRHDSSWFRLDLGTGYKRLAKALCEIQGETDIALEGFSSMDEQRVSLLTGLSLAQAKLAKLRYWDEPFVAPALSPQDRARLKKAAAARGLNITGGGRFFHLHGGSDKGRAAALLKSWYRRQNPDARFAALGDSDNDIPMLEQADFPIFVGSKGKLPESPANLAASAIPGPKGWNSEVLRLLKKCGFGV